MYAKDFRKNTKGSVRVYSGKPNQLLPKFRMQHVSEGTIPSFYLSFFPKKTEDASDEHGERFHQDIVSMKSRYKKNYAQLSWQTSAGTET